MLCPERAYRIPLPLSLLAAQMQPYYLASVFACHVIRFQALVALGMREERTLLDWM